MVSFSLLGVASFQTEASGSLALPVADAFEYKGIFKAQRKELSLQLIVLYLQCMAIALSDFCIGYSGRLSPSIAAPGFRRFFCALPEIITLFALLLRQLPQTSNRLVIILLIKHFLDKGFPGWSLNPWVPNRYLCLCMESLVIDLEGITQLLYCDMKAGKNNLALQLSKC